jgi:hypothetical protein
MLRLRYCFQYNETIGFILQSLKSIALDCDSKTPGLLTDFVVHGECYNNTKKS